MSHSPQTRWLWIRLYDYIITFILSRQILSQRLNHFLSNGYQRKRCVHRLHSNAPPSILPNPNKNPENRIPKRQHNLFPSLGLLCRHINDQPSHLGGATSQNRREILWSSQELYLWYLALLLHCASTNGCFLSF